MKRKKIGLFKFGLNFKTNSLLSLINDINYNIEFTCDIDTEGRVCFTMIIFSSTFIIGVVFKSRLSINQGGVFTEALHPWSS